MNPLISFIITYHNEPKDYLTTCLERIFSLTMSDEEREVIVVDDGSDTSPASWEELQKWPIVFIRQENQGISMARNMGFLRATGEYVQFVDADDSLVSMAYDEVVKLLRRDRPDALMFDHTQQDGLRNVRHRETRPMSGPEYMRSHNINGAVWSMVFKRMLMVDMAFTPGITYGEDEEMTALLMMRATTFVRTTLRPYHYRQHPSSATHQVDEKAIGKRFSDYMQVIERLRMEAFTHEGIRREALNRRTDQLTLDVVYNAIRLSHSPRFVEAQVDELERIGLFPVIFKPYTLRYVVFHLLTGNRWGRWCLCKML